MRRSLAITIVPLVLATGAGAESRMQIGWVIVGGMSVGTLLTLFVVPCVYVIMGRRHVSAAAPGADAPLPPAAAKDEPLKIAAE